MTKLLVAFVFGLIAWGILTQVVAVPTLLVGGGIALATLMGYKIP